MDRLTDIPDPYVHALVAGGYYNDDIEERGLHRRNGLLDEWAPDEGRLQVEGGGWAVPIPAEDRTGTEIAVAAAPEPGRIPVDREPYREALLEVVSREVDTAGLYGIHGRMGTNPETWHNVGFYLPAERLDSYPDGDRAHLETPHQQAVNFLSGVHDWAVYRETDGGWEQVAVRDSAHRSPTGRDILYTAGDLSTGPDIGADIDRDPVPYSERG
ncbi:MAG: hypothetical protein ABEI97_00420 [Candidatus Nanohaloarchaea archaeon]